MKQSNFTYAGADSCFYEAMRINKGSSSEWSAAKEGNALVDTNRTEMNVELIPHHEALNPSDFRKHNRGAGIAEYHLEVTGRSARMNGDEKQRSKAVGCIITLPRDYMDIDFGLTVEEYEAVEKFVEREHGTGKQPKSEAYRTAMEKVSHHVWTDEEQTQITEFFQAALKAWQKVATVRDEDMLYAVVHFDESFPHLHIMALPTVVKENGDITFSTSKYNNRTNHYYDRLHTEVISEMQKLGIDGSGLLNGATKERAFSPVDMSRSLREEAEELIAKTILTKQGLRQKENELSSREANISNQEAGLSNREEELNKKDKERKQRENRLEEKEDMLNVKLFEVQNQKKALENREAKIPERAKKEADNMFLERYQPMIDEYRSSFRNIADTVEEILINVLGTEFVEKHKMVILNSMAETLGLADLKETKEEIEKNGTGYEDIDDFDDFNLE